MSPEERDLGRESRARFGRRCRCSVAGTSLWRSLPVTFREPRASPASVTGTISDVSGLTSLSVRDRCSIPCPPRGPAVIPRRGLCRWNAEEGIAYFTPGGDCPQNTESFRADE